MGVAVWPIGLDQDQEVLLFSTLQAFGGCRASMAEAASHAIVPNASDISSHKSGILRSRIARFRSIQAGKEGAESPVVSFSWLEEVLSGGQCPFDLGVCRKHLPDILQERLCSITQTESSGKRLRVEATVQDLD